MIKEFTPYVVDALGDKKEARIQFILEADTHNNHSRFFERLELENPDEVYQIAKKLAAIIASDLWNVVELSKKGETTVYD
jgi:hypothetical protein